MSVSLVFSFELLWAPGDPELAGSMVSTHLTHSPLTDEADSGPCVGLGQWRASGLVVGKAGY